MYLLHEAMTTGSPPSGKRELHHWPGVHPNHSTTRMRRAGALRWRRSTLRLGKHTRLIAIKMVSGQWNEYLCVNN